MPGTPEVFTGWAFIFNTPANCTVPNQCFPSPADFDAGHGAAYNFAGHAISGGGSLNFVGNVSVGEAPIYALPPGVVAFFPLANPYGAEVHLAVAPHGLLIPDLLPQQLNSPIAMRQRFSLSEGGGRLHRCPPFPNTHPLLYDTLDRPELSPRELAVTFTDTDGYFVSESPVYRLMKAHDLITSPAFIVMQAASARA